MQQDNFPNFNTPRLRLDRMTQSDRDAIFSVFSDPQVVAHYDVEQFVNVYEAERLVEYFDARYAADSGIRWAIRDAHSGQYMGSCGFTNWNEFDHSAVISYELAPAFWQQGYASEAIKTIINYVFSQDFHFYVHRIEALILPTNEASKKLLQRFGFQYEGTLRGKCYWNERFHDMDMYGLLQEDLVQ